MACTCQPGKAMCRSCLQSIYERNAVPAGATSNAYGEYTLNQVAVFEKKFTDGIVEDISGNPLTVAAKKYPDFYETLGTINNDFLKRPNIIAQLPNYNILNKRLERGPLTPIEWATFLRSSNYTPTTAIASSNAKGSRFLDELDKYYNGDFADSVLGGFCGLFSSIYGAINAFFDIMDSIAGAIQDVLAFIQKIKNIKDEVIAFFEAIKVKALIEAIKEKVAEMVKQAIQKVCQSIANFNVEAITGPLPNPTPAQIKMVEKQEEKKELLTEVCGEENANLIKAKIQNLIDYAVGLFENPSLEEILALIARICAMATGLEQLFKKLKDPLTDFQDRYQEVFNTLSNASNRVTGEAIRAGAIRPTEEVRQREINRARERQTAAGNPNAVEPQEVAGLPTWEMIKDNNHPLIRIQGGWTTRMRPASEGWTRMAPQVRVMIMRLQRRAAEEGIINGPLILNSGFRSQQYNDLLRSEGVGAAKNSQHLNGNAADLTWSGFRSRGDNLLRFVALAREVGFRGIGYYNSFVHVDIGPTRSWDRR
jgi:hypothetical protein